MGSDRDLVAAIAQANSLTLVMQVFFAFRKVGALLQEFNLRAASRLATLSL
jgi:hypothetical protein